MRTLESQNCNYSKGRRPFVTLRSASVEEILDEVKIKKDCGSRTATTSIPICTPIPITRLLLKLSINLIYDRRPMSCVGVFDIIKLFILCVDLGFARKALKGDEDRSHWNSVYVRDITVIIMIWHESVLFILL